VGVTGPQAFGIIADHLKAAGEGGLRRELYKAINDAAKPLAREIGSVAHLDPYLPDPYAAVLAEALSVSVSKIAGPNPAVRLRAVGGKDGRRRSRHVARINEGILRHPVFGTEAQREAHITAGGSSHHGRGWTWVNQRVQPGFFTDPTEKAAPEIRRHIVAAMTDVVNKASRKV
jgi:hypothetical protein